MRFLIIGDSQAHGAPGRTAEAQLRSLGHAVQRHGHVSRGATQWVGTALFAEYRGALTGFRPQHVLLIFGVNDHDSGSGELGFARESLPAALRRLRDATRVPVWMSGPPHYPGAAHERWGADIRAVNMSVFGTRFIDAYRWTTDSRQPRTPDGLHFTREGGAVWGVPLANELARVAAG